MKFPPLELGQAVKITWVDSKSALGWVYGASSPRKPGYIKSLGYVVQLNKECLTITTSLGERGESIDDLSIPLGCIQDVVEVEILEEQNG